MLIDTHCHLDDHYFKEGADAVIERARGAGVGTFVVIGVGEDLTPAKGAIALASRREDVFATVGLHPHDARVFTDAFLEEMEQLARSPKVVAIGEVGLDYHYMHSPREVQQSVFRRMIGLARSMKKPIVVHT